MTELFSPFLCGGTLFNLLLLASQKRNVSSVTEATSIKDRDVLRGLIEAITGAPCTLQDGTFKRHTSEYKSCMRASDSVLPFDNPNTAAAYDNVVRFKYADAKKWMTQFVWDYIDPQKKWQLVSSIIELIRDDTTIPGPQHFFVESDGLPYTKDQIAKISTVSLPEFLVGVIHFVVTKRQNMNDRGLDTLDYWGPKKPNQVRDFHEYPFGTSIRRYIAITIPSLAEANEQIEAPDIMRNDTDDPFSIYLEKAKYDLSTVKTTFRSDVDPTFKEIFVCTDLSPTGQTSDSRMVNATIPKIERICNHVIIVGLGGAGKSMMLRHLFYERADNYAASGMLPVYMELKRYTPGESLQDFILRSVRIYDRCVTGDQVEALICEKKCYLICDAVDELPSGGFCQFQVAVDQFTKRNPDITIIMTSRPTQKSHSFSHFSVWRSLGLTKDQAIELISRVTYYDSQARDEFLKALDDHLYEQHKEYARNPLLLTIMLATYRKYGDVPTKLHLFFERAYKTLLSDHDSMKIGFRRVLFTSLESNEYEPFFSEFCARSYDARTLDFTEEQFCELMEPVIKRQHLYNGALPIDFLYDAVTNICIMYKEGYEYHFIHRSFQEYFTAKFYADHIATSPDLVSSYFEHYQARWDGEATFAMLFGMKQHEMELLVLLPYHEHLWNKCGDEDDMESYWNFLQEMYPTISINTNPEEDPLELRAKSFLYDFYSRYAECSHADELTNMNWSNRIITLCEGEFFLRTTFEEPDEIGSQHSVNRIIPFDTFEHGDLRPGYEDDIVGYRFCIRTKDVCDRKALAPLKKIMEQPNFPLMKEYREMRALTGEMRKRLTDSRASGNWFDKFSA